MHLTKSDINTYKNILHNIQELIYTYFDEFIKCDISYELLDWEHVNEYEFTITYSYIDFETGEKRNDYITITLDDLNGDIVTDTVNILEQNPKAQTCVLTNHGIITDVIFK